MIGALLVDAVSRLTARARLTTAFGIALAVLPAVAIAVKLARGKR